MDLLVVVLVLLLLGGWGGGIYLGYTGAVHILLLVALVVILIRLLRGQPVA